jgi:YVTN family beta-propeller protein
MPMSFRRVGLLAATVMGTLLWMSCGEVYRPVVIPVSTTPPNSGNFHSVFGISSNVPPNPGTALEIDVSGDTNIGVANMGLNPTHAVNLPNNSRVFVASAGSLTPGDPDIISAFTPAGGSSIAIGITSGTVFSLPNVGPEQSAAITAISESGNVVTATLSAAIPMATVGGPIVISGVPIGGYNGNFTVSSVNGSTIQYVASATQLLASAGGSATVPLPTFCSYLPDFVATSQNTQVFVANYGVENGPNCALASTDSVAQLSAVTGAVANIAYLPGTGSAPHPVALAETPNGQHLYVVNQGDSTVVDLSPTDLSQIANIPVGTTPVWAVARADNQRVYVLSQGSGTLIAIDTATDTILQSQTNLSVGAGANFVLYDPHLNRLYVTNPSSGQVFIYSATGGVDLSGNANDTPKLLSTITMTAGGSKAPCSKACSPVSVAALPDGSRFYVASYRSEGVCSDGNVGPTACIVPMLTVFDAASMTVKPANSTLLKSGSSPSPSMSLLSSPPFSATQYAVSPNASCVTPATYSPGATRFRMFTTASSDGSHVYVSMCDAGAVASIRTNTNTFTQGSNAPDTLIADISAPFGSCSGANCSSSFPITGFSIAANVVTIQTNQIVNNFVPGEQVQISGLTAGAFLNGQTLTVLSSGLSGTQFAAKFPHADVAQTADSGTALGLQVANITSLSINAGVITFEAVNTFSAGTRVAISGLSSGPAVNAGLNGATLTVIAKGLSSTQFECVLPTPSTNVGATPDSGLAVPQVPPQTPIFVLAGS